MKKNLVVLLLAFALLAALILVYSNHFHNAFHFDDSHTIVNNIYIRDIKNIPLFFKDGSTISSLPANQVYRPMLVTSFAIDYWMGGGLGDTFYFHLSTFIWYLLQLVCMYFLLLKLFQLSKPHPWNNYIAFAAVAWYGLHTANAETINYVSARSDSVSTFWFVLALLMFVGLPKLRWWCLYLIPLFIGAMYKPPVLVFPAIAFLYVLFFESPRDENWRLLPSWASFLDAFLHMLPSLLVCAFLFWFQGWMTPSTFTPGGSRYHYMITQPFVSLHYFVNFFVPYDLSADTDWLPLESMKDWRFAAGMLFIIAMLAIVLFTFRKPSTRPVAFGIAWFFIALLPSSSIVPLAEVMNDHRTFFPYIGLLISSVWGLWLLLQKAEDRIRSSAGVRILISTVIVVSLSGYAWGTVNRNKVWATDESLWYDVTQKSPKNARGQMNYGLVLMSRANYKEAEKYLEKSLEIWPYYSYGHVNMGILKAALGDPKSAEQYFKNALQYDPKNPEGYYYYAQFLFNQGRKDEAIPLLKQCLALTPAHSYAHGLLMAAYADKEDWDSLRKAAEETLAIFPGDPVAQNYLEISKHPVSKLDAALQEAKKNHTPEGYLALSLTYYNAGKYRECIDACNEALKLKPDYAEAYNNICSAHNLLGEFKEAAAACEKAMQLKSGYELAKNNLLFVKQREQVIGQAVKTAKQKNTAEEYLNLSLVYYNQGLYLQCIDACKQALKLKPGYAAAYNNICSAYNQLKMWDEAIKAGEEAVRLDPASELAKNNLNWARSQRR